MNIYPLNEVSPISPERYLTGMEYFDNVLGGGLVQGSTMIMAGDTGSGKCFGKDTQVLMYDGTIKNVQDVKVGDVLMGDDSEPRHVLKLSRGIGNLYKVEYKNGEYYIVNDNHILSLKRSSNRSMHKHGDILNIPIKEYINKTQGWKNGYKGYKVGVKFSYKKVDIDPYYLGIWLGDGHSENQRITNPDKEVINFLKKYAKQNKLSLKKVGNSKYTYTLSGSNYGKNPILRMLRKYNLLKNKHIPFVYKTNSEKVRLVLLAGLMDSDGYNTKRHYFEYITKRETLANDIIYLARSLGFWANVKMVQKKSQNGTVGNYYRITILGDVWKIPTRIKRKKIGYFKVIWNRLQREIKITPVGTGNYYGFEVDENNLFLLGDFTVTHNSTSLTQVSYGLAKNGKHILYIAGEESKEQIKMRTERLAVNSDVIFLCEDVKVEDIVKAINAIVPDVVIIDSLQMIYSDNVKSAIGTPSQMKNGLMTLCKVAKDMGITIIFVGHATKGGYIAGLQTFQHMVDTVLYLGINEDGTRFLKVNKNRFGQTGVSQDLYMTKYGLFSEENVTQPFGEMRNEDERIFSIDEINKMVEGKMAKPIILASVNWLKDNIKNNPDINLCNGTATLTSKIINDMTKNNPVWRVAVKYSLDWLEKNYYETQGQAQVS